MSKRKIPPNERGEVRKASEIMKRIEALASASKKNAKDPQLVMAYISAERRKARALAAAILDVQDEDQERWTPSETACELARLVLAAIRPEPEDPDYDSWASGDPRAHGRR